MGTARGELDRGKICWAGSGTGSSMFEVVPNRTKRGLLSGLCLLSLVSYLLTLSPRGKNESVKVNYGYVISWAYRRKRSPSHSKYSTSLSLDGSRSRKWAAIVLTKR
ncbi:hypothetical protein BDV23DRAFT_153478 [Aspergillus alliaceus]|uniref:Uncharacterized protein n=1 Tax=Petromyces alliaceus TaxID=209559 RepID=A0A5N7CB61_PETAA|nr:hypothetical protein BDV23DRAFT_153478 [Aspergillus alliaceus]